MEDGYLAYITKAGPDEIREIVEKYWDDIWNYAYFLIHKHDAADDIAQETFVKAFLSLPQFRGECAVKTWLLTICRHCAANYRRAAFVRKMIPVAFVKPAAVSASAESVYFAHEEVGQIYRQLFVLPPKYREVLLLEIRHELSMKEIAGILGVPEGTVKSRLNRARTNLKKKLKEDEA